MRSFESVFGHIVGVAAVLGVISWMNAPPYTPQPAGELRPLLPWCAKLAPILRERYPDMHGASAKTWRLHLNAVTGLEIAGDMPIDAACREWYAVIESAV